MLFDLYYVIVSGFGPPETPKTSFARSRNGGMKKNDVTWEGESVLTPKSSIISPSSSMPSLSPPSSLPSTPVSASANSPLELDAFRLSESTQAFPPLTPSLVSVKSMNFEPITPEKKVRFNKGFDPIVPLPEVLTPKKMPSPPKSTQRVTQPLPSNDSNVDSPTNISLTARMRNLFAGSEKYKIEVESKINALGEEMFNYLINNNFIKKPRDILGFNYQLHEDTLKIYPIKEIRGSLDTQLESMRTVPLFVIKKSDLPVDEKEFELLKKEEKKANEYFSQNYKVKFHLPEKQIKFINPVTKSYFYIAIYPPLMLDQPLSVKDFLKKLKVGVFEENEATKGLFEVLGQPIFKNVSLDNIYFDAHNPKLLIVTNYNPPKLSIDDIINADIKKWEKSVEKEPYKNLTNFEIVARSTSGVIDAELVNELMENRYIIMPKKVERIFTNISHDNTEINGVYSFSEDGKEPTEKSMRFYIIKKLEKPISFNDIKKLRTLEDKLNKQDFKEKERFLYKFLLPTNQIKVINPETNEIFYAGIYPQIPTTQFISLDYLIQRKSLMPNASSAYPMWEVYGSIVGDLHRIMKRDFKEEDQFTLGSLTPENIFIDKNNQKYLVITNCEYPFTQTASDEIDVDITNWFNKKSELQSEDLRKAIWDYFINGYNSRISKINE